MPHQVAFYGWFVICSLYLLYPALATRYTTALQAYARLVVDARGLPVGPMPLCTARYGHYSRALRAPLAGRPGLPRLPRLPTRPPTARPIVQ
jgi:hypothetical protein